MTVSSDDGYIHVNYGQVNDVYDALQKATQSIEMVLQELETAIQPLTAVWAGVSQDEYHMVQARWTQDIADMTGTLAANAATLDEMKINYGNTDNNLAFGWQGILG
jgi:WXG100 family type VII secretion target